MALHKIIMMLVYAAALCVPFSNADSCSDVVLSRLGSNCDRLSRDAVSSFIVAAGPSGTFSPSGCDCGSTAQIVSFIFSGWPQQLERNNQTINNATLLAWQQYFAVQSANVVYWKFSSVAPPEKSRVAQTVLSLRCQLGLGECVSPALTAGRVFLQVNINVNPVAIHTFSVQYAAPDEYYIWMGYAQVSGNGNVMVCFTLSLSPFHTFSLRRLTSTLGSIRFPMQTETLRVCRRLRGGSMQRK